MADSQRSARLARILAAAGRAHHDVVEEPGHDWAVWYADYLSDRVDEVLGITPSSEEIAVWLRAADEKHRAEAPDVGWPRFYADYILDEVLPERR